MTISTKTKKYTDEEFEAIKLAYQKSPTIETIARLAEEFKKPKKSIIAKLASAGVYQRSSYSPKYGEKAITKIEIVENIAGCLGLDYSSIAGLVKAEKMALLLLSERINETADT